MGLAEKPLAVIRQTIQPLEEKIFNLKNLSLIAYGKKMTVSRNLAKILIISYKSHHPIEALLNGLLYRFRFFGW